MVPWCATNKAKHITKNSTSEARREDDHSSPSRAGYDVSELSQSAQSSSQILPPSLVGASGATGPSPSAVASRARKNPQTQVSDAPAPPRCEASPEPGQRRRPCAPWLRYSYSTRDSPKQNDLAEAATGTQQTSAHYFFGVFSQSCSHHICALSVYIQ